MNTPTPSADTALKTAARTIVFDLDGTLVDSAPDLWRATNHVLAHAGRPPVTLEAVRHMVGRGARVLMERGLRATGGMGDHDLDALLPVFLNYYGDHIADETILFDGGLALLQDLKADGFQVALCTNKPEGLARKLLDALDITRYFDAITGGDTFDFRKPDPRHISETAAIAGTSGPIVMVGDSISDIAGAQNLGVPSIAVTFGYSDEPIESLGATYLVDSLREIRALLTLA